MAINRFDTFLPNDYSFQVYEPQVYTPDLSMLDSLLGGIQQEYDVGKSKLNQVMPNYLRNSPTDVEGARQFRQKYDAAMEQATNAFASGDVSTGRSIMSDALREIERDQLPGGDYFELERRLGEYQNTKENLRKLYIDEYQSPELYDLAINKLNQGISPFRDVDTGEYGSIGEPQMAKYIPQEEVVDQLDQIIDNIEADQIVYGGYRTKNLQGVSFKDLLERGELEKIDYSKVANVLASAVTPEMQASYEQLGEAMGLEGQGRVMASDEEFEETGSWFAPTMAGRTLESLAQSKVYQKQKDKSQVVADTFSQAKALKEMEEKDKFLRSMRTQVYTKGSGMPEFDMKIKNGRIIVGDKRDVKAGDFRPGFRKSGAFKESAIDNDISITGIISDSDKLAALEKDMPGIEEIVNEFRGTLESMNPDDAGEFIKTKYNQKREALSMTDDVVYIYSEDTRNTMNDLYLGTTKGTDDARVGLMDNMSTVIYEPGQEPKVVEGAEAVADELGISLRDFIQHSNLHGEVRPDNPAVIAGIRGTYNNGEKVVQFSLADKDFQEVQTNLPYATLGSVTHDGTLDKSAMTSIPMPNRNEAGELEFQNVAVYSKGQDVYTSDILRDQLNSYRKSVREGQPTMTEEDAKKVEAQYQAILANPRLDEFQGRDAIIYHGGTHKPLKYSNGKNITYDDLLKMRAAQNANQ